MSLLHRTTLGVAVSALAVGVATASAATTTKLKATLKGSSVPTKGDPDGRGTATITIKGSELCYSLSLSNVEATDGGHIHKGKSGVVGAIIVPLYNGKEKRKGCKTVSPIMAAQIVDHPSGFYVNLHNKQFPKGAVRGQLRKG